MSAECGTHGTDLAYPEGTWPVGICVQCELDNDLEWVRKDRDSWRVMATTANERGDNLRMALDERNEMYGEALARIKELEGGR